MKATKRIGHMLTGATVAMVAFAMLSSGVAEAQSPRYRRTVKVKVKVKQSEKTKKIERKKKKEVRPKLTADDFIKLQGKIGSIRMAQVVKYKQLIKITEPSDPQLPDYHFRLAELYAQMARYTRFKGMELHSKIDRARGNQKRVLVGRQKKYFKQHGQWLGLAVKRYMRLANTARFKNYPRMPEALFYFAFMLQDAKKMAEARKIYYRLITDYPNSKFIPQAYLAFADYFFEQNAMDQALNFYNKVLRFKRSPVWIYALYKKGWVYLNKREFQAALETFYEVAQKTRGNRSKSVINTAAKKDYVRAYSEIGKAKMAYRAFQRVDRGYAFKMLQILAELYLDKGKLPNAIYTFRTMMKTKPRHKLLCEWQYNIVHAMLSATTPIKQKVDEIGRLVKLYVALNKRKSLPKAQMDECYENAQAVNSEMAKVWHSEANKTLNTSTLVYVDRLYQLYLNSFKRTEDYGEMQYYYAELMWQRADAEKNARKATDLWQQAAVAFTDVVKSGLVNKKQRKEAAYAAVLGWKNALAVDPRTEAPPADKEYKKIPKPKPLDPRQKKMIEAFDIYINYIKDVKDKELVMMKFLKARIYWRHNQFDKAVPLFEDIIKHHMEHETAVYTVNLLLDTLNRWQKYGKMIQWVYFLLEKRSKWLADKPDLRERLSLLKRQSERKAAEKLHNDKKYVECGQAFLKIFNDNPNSKKANEVLFNAGNCFQKGKSIGAAITMFQILAERFPRSNEAQRAMEALGRNYSDIAWYSKAAQQFERYARKYGGEKNAYSVLGEAVFYRRGLGHDDKAIKLTKFFMRQYGKKKKHRAQAAEAYYNLQSIYEKDRDKDKVIGHLRRYLSQWGKHGGAHRRVMAHARIGEILWQQSCKRRGVMGACIQVQRQRASLRRRKRRRRRKKGVEIPRMCAKDKISVKVLDRDKKKSYLARKSLTSAVKAYNRWAKSKGKAKFKGMGTGEARDANVRNMQRAYAKALFYLAERDYEKFLKIEFPKKLDFGRFEEPKDKKKREKALKKLKKYLKTKSKAMEKLVKIPSGKYRKIVELKGGTSHWSIAAAARIGQAAQNYAGALYTAPIPKTVRTGKWALDKVDAYCDEMSKQGDPLEKVAIGAYGFCLKKSTQRSWFNQWSRLCEKELGQLRPQDFPTATEIRSEADNDRAITDMEKAVLKLEGGAP